MLKNSVLNIVVPMAGQGSRFQVAGYKEPKPLIPVLGKPMIEAVIENLRPRRFDHRFIFLVRQEALDQYGLADKLRAWAPGSHVVPVEKLTEGAACTVLLAEKFIDNDQPMMIANCDQIVDLDMDDYLTSMDSNGWDGLIMTMKANDPKWSFVRLNDKGLVTEVVEKKVISDEATVGIYNFKRGHDFVRAAKNMIQKNLRVNGEFYVAPTYNQLIEEGARIGIYNIGSEFQGMYGLGIPEDLRKFESARPRLAHFHF